MMLEAVGYSMLSRAAEQKLVSFHAVNPRDFTTDKHRTVDEKPFGGGPGMLLKPEPIYQAFESLQLEPNAAVVVPEPTGYMFNQEVARELSTKQRIVFLCGHYEGIDERVVGKIATHRVSIGDYVLTGGELPALVITDAIVRLLPGVLGCAESLEIDSHADGLLSAPQFTRPDTFLEVSVPEVLKSGDHQAVETWKRKEALKLTRTRRPDLFCRAKLAKEDPNLLSS